MATVLTVDDSRAVRSILARTLTQWGLEVAQAEDGKKGLQSLMEASYDLVLLDVTMPEMDGPTMLANMRDRGDKTPVLMLTSESKTSIVADAMKRGIEDYILKPFKPDELKAKISKVIPLSEETAKADSTKDGLDILLIDDIENVHTKFKALLPENKTLETCTNAPAALALARGHRFSVVVLDNQIPDVNSVALMNQIRALQPKARMLSLCLKSTENAREEAASNGFDGVVFKPLTPDGIAEFLSEHLEPAPTPSGNPESEGPVEEDVLVVEGTSIRVGRYNGPDDGLDEYFNDLKEKLTSNVQALAEACFDTLELDATSIAIRSDATVRVLVGLAEQAEQLGISLSLRGTGELRHLLQRFAETASLPFEESK